MADGQGWTCPNCGHINRAGARFCSRCRTQNPAVAGGTAGGGVTTQRIPTAPGAPARASAPPAPWVAPRPASPDGNGGAAPDAMRAAGQELLSKVGNVQF